MLSAACLLSTLSLAQAQAQQAPAAGPIQSVKVVSQRNPSTWFKAESQHFVVYSDTDHDEATRLLNNLERLDYLLRVYTKGYDKTGNDERKLTLYYAARVEDLGGLGLGQPPSAVGLYNSCAAGVTGFAVQLHAIDDLTGPQLAMAPLNDSLSHIFEAYARHFLYRHTDIRAPIWFIDGFAHYFSSIRFTDTQLVVGRTPTALGGYLRFIDNGRRYSLDYSDILNQNDSKGNNYAKEAGVKLEFEAKSWRLVHYILSTEDNRQRLGAYLKAFYDGTPSVQAFENSFGIKLGDLSTTMWRYGLQSSRVLTVDQPALPRAVVNFTGLPKAASDFVLEDAALKACPGKEAGAKMLAAVRADVASWPNDATGKLALSRAEIEVGQGARALPYLNQALTKDDANAELHLLAGLAHLRLAEQDAAGRTAHLADAQRQLVRARELDPVSPGVVLATLRADLIATGTPSQAALDGVLAAWRRGRDVGALGKSAALAYAWLGDGISAANILKSMASNRRDPEAAAWAEGWARRLDTGLTRADLLQGLQGDPWTAGAFREWTIAQEDVLQTVVTNAGFEDARHALSQTMDGNVSRNSLSSPPDTPIPANR
jgi:hypothetical protein